MTKIGAAVASNNIILDKERVVKIDCRDLSLI
jgi:hypothetical protein